MLCRKNIGVNWKTNCTIRVLLISVGIFFLTLVAASNVLKEEVLQIDNSSHLMPKEFVIHAPAGSWILISAPTDTLIPLPLGGWIWNATSQKYEFVKTVPFGHGVWIQSGQYTLNLTKRNLQNLCFFLSPGWNLVGSFPDTIPISNLRDCSTGVAPVCLLLDNIWTFRNKKYEKVQFFEPWFGYWIYSRKEVKIEVILN